MGGMSAYEKKRNREKEAHRRSEQPHYTSDSGNVRVRHTSHQSDERSVENGVKADADETNVEPFVERGGIGAEEGKENRADDGEETDQYGGLAILAGLVDVETGSETANNVSDRSREEVRAGGGGGSPVDRKEEDWHCVHQSEVGHRDEDRDEHHKHWSLLSEDAVRKNWKGRESAWEDGMRR
jgi:hypothetical protein